MKDCSAFGVALGEYAEYFGVYGVWIESRRRLG